MDKQMQTYFIQMRPEGPVKIGRSKDPKRRLVELQAAAVVKLEIIGLIAGDHESELHEQFQSSRIKGEWFKPSRELMEFIARFADIPSEFQFDALKRLARSVVGEFDAMKPEVIHMWRVFGSSYEKDDCPWPHMMAFDNAVESLRRFI